ncbi:MAG: RpiB/LacA/LacB family sugar-phosphate isomerase [Malacoplasma sp.]|nr:RpiB/LacA/LacB family sugar-phosphate isomerase [Malacoplasma sp.]MDE5775093.1 RpiB/LacA/LacB family sugar-phosphate isomerase [Malacoplasma sp.]MDE7099629.1 RpiB/LacA/LacB family sugar-phosphate isomerase [Malacoplasma sp.]
MNQSQNASQKIRVYIGSDHGGFLMKENLKKVSELNCFIDFIDVGTYSEDSVDYPDYAKKIADKLLEDKGSYGIGICGTGIGICIALNKIKGIYAANVNKVVEAELAKEHNNVNVITLSGRFSTLEENVLIVKKFFSSTFQEGRHKQRLEKIKKMEEKNE